MSTSDFIERRWPRRELNGSDQHTLIANATTALRERGAVFFRVSVREMTKEIIVEGWLSTPKEQGDIPL